MSDLLDVKLVIDKDCQKLGVVITSKEKNEDVEGLLAAIQAYRFFCCRSAGESDKTHHRERFCSEHA